MSVYLLIAYLFACALALRWLLNLPGDDEIVRLRKHRDIVDEITREQALKRVLRADYRRGAKR